MSEDCLRVASVGAGYYGQFHLQAWTQIVGAKLVAICDEDAAKARDAASRWNIPAWYTNVDDMIARDRPALLDLAAPPASHLGLVGQAARAGIDAICQKPFCRNLAEAKEAVAIAKAAGIRLIVHENFRFQPWYVAINGLLGAGAIGRVEQIAFRLRPGDGRGENAYISRQPYFRSMERLLIQETGVHFIDTFRFLVGEISGVYARLRRLNTAIAGEDAGIVIFDFIGGAQGIFDGNRLSDHAAPNMRLTMGEMLIEGSDGSLRLDGWGQVHLRKAGSLEESPIPVAIDREAIGGGSVRALQQHVVAHILSGGRLANAAGEYLKNLEVVEAIYRSAATGRHVVL